MMNENFITRVIKILIEQRLSETHKPEGYDKQRDDKLTGEGEKRKYEGWSADKGDDESDEDYKRRVARETAETNRALDPNRNRRAKWGGRWHNVR